MTITEFNTLPEKEAFKALFTCCGSAVWAQSLVEKRLFTSLEELKEISDILWEQATESDLMEAFSHHPKIGDVKSLEKKFASTAAWASGEQSGVNQASQEVIKKLANGNAQYEEKFGFIYIVCATGKSAPEMLEILEARLPNHRALELRVAAREQNKITHLRLDKLFSSIV